MPAHNAARWIGAAIDCVLSQSWPRLELIVADDASTDGTVAVARGFRSPRVRIIQRRENGGGQLARQLALEQAQGDFIQYLDADDLIDREKISLQLRELLSEDPGLVASCRWSRFYGDAPELAAVGVRESVWGSFDPVDWIVTSQLGGGMMPIHAWLTPRDVADRAGPWMTRKARNADGEYFARVLLASRGVRFVEGATVYYRSGIGGWSGSHDRAALEGYLETLERIAENLLEAENSARTRLAAATMYKRFAFLVYPHAADLVARAEGASDALGGSDLRAEGGAVFRAVSSMVGWKAARRLQQIAWRVRRRGVRLGGAAGWAPNWMTERLRSQRLA